MSDIEDMVADPMPWANKILCRYKDGHPTKRFLREGEDRVLLGEITRLRTLLSEAEQREKDARRVALEEAAKVVDVAAEKNPWEQRRNSLRRAAKAIRALQSEER